MSEGGLYRSTGMKTEPRRRTRMNTRPYTCSVHTRVRVPVCGQPATRAHAGERAQLVRATVKTKEYMKEMLITTLLVGQP